jgi:hypothetical protein
MKKKFSHKMGGKEVGQAEVYAEPHTMTGRPYTTADLGNGYGPSQGSAAQQLKMSVGNISSGTPAPEKTTGIKIRGTGCATKGTMARGPMA